MARRSSRIRGVNEKNEVSCMWGLFSILESCEGRPSQKVISNGRPLNRLITDYARKLDPIASFDEECRKIHNGDGKSRSMRSSHGDVMPIEKHKSRGDVMKRCQYAKMEAELHDYPMKTHMKTRKSSQEAYQSSSSCLNNAARTLMTEPPSTSAELSLNKLTIAAVLGAVCAQNHREESKLSEYFQKNCYLGKYSQNDEINFQQVQMRAKAFVDQMFMDRMLLKEGRNSESKSFSNALEVLSSKKALFMELLPDPNSMLARRAKDSNPDKDTVKSILAANIPECEGALVMHEGSVEDILWNKTDYQLKSSPERDSDKIVILKPLPPSAKHCKNVSCSCSSLQFSNRSGRRVSDVKTASFSFRKMKKKLKHTFGVARKDRSTPGVESECIFDDGKKGKVLKNQELKSDKGSDVACVTDSTRRKLDYTSARCSNKHEFDVILEAKRHLSTRLNNLNSLEAVMIKKSPRTLERILSSPEPEIWPFSPRRDGVYLSGSEMRFSPYNMSPRIIDVGITSCDDHSKSLKTADARDSSVSSSDNMNFHGEAKNAEMNKFLPPESRFSGEVPSKTSSSCISESSEMTDTIKAQKSDGSNVMHSLPDSLQENDVAVTSTAESIKYQEEHRSPVSVLEPFFVEDANSPPSIITLQPARQKLQPRCLDFEGCSFPDYQSPSVDSWIDEDHLCQYVQSVIEASSLNWDQLSEITSHPEELLLESLFHEVELPPHDCYYDPKLLFDHINEVLLAIYKRHFCYPPWLAPKTAHAPLAELVLAEILADGAEFFLLPTTERRTLDQLVSRDVASSRSWVDVQLDMEHIAIEISEAVMEESLLDTLLQFHS